MAPSDERKSERTRREVRERVSVHYLLLIIILSLWCIDWFTLWIWGTQWIEVDYIGHIVLGSDSVRYYYFIKQKFKQLSSVIYAQSQSRPNFDPFNQVSRAHAIVVLAKKFDAIEFRCISGKVYAR